ncbi:Uncharacterised protein [uncultured archaeon]|nr:Uncharacterised protein [uncultured archaeon]
MMYWIVLLTAEPLEGIMLPNWSQTPVIERLYRTLRLRGETVAVLICTVRLSEKRAALDTVRGGKNTYKLLFSAVV